ncbi:glycosyltransferase [Clostridium sp. SM-530-WT-3G]|uniref:glycosyltransferase n=1 Tax=Clostridium sp. SM-530-WT-3G TaxID=2725303 RepID=UPI00145DA2BD|nr:glycosyltransferase [Clostridium sp. SM-530-WT-3G]NME83079.1 glycosyltransferase family 4 protein [Clostridium sp. SM-530-WT-3G]
MKILYFSTVNWKWIKQRPHFICTYLSESGYDITYLSITPFLKQKKFTGKLNKNLSIKDKYVIPYSSKIKVVKLINRFYIKSILKKENYDIVILTHPEQYQYLPDDLLDKKVKKIYECMDNIPYFYSGSMREKVIEQERMLCKNVDYIIASSNYLKEKIVNNYMADSNKIEVIKNALDSSILLSNNHSEIKLSHPNLVYIGTVGEWFDMDVLEKFARKYSYYKIYIIGPVDKEKVKRRKSKNIIFIGSIDHKQISNYIQNGDIMLIPFKVNELIKGVDPVKIYEYLVFNKPVLTSYWKELEGYKENEYVYFYENFDEFVKNVESIVNNNICNTNINYNFYQKNNWLSRVDKYRVIIKNLYKTQKLNE